MKKNLLCQARKNNGRIFQTKAGSLFQGVEKIRVDTSKAQNIACSGLFKANYLLTLFAYQTT